MTFTNQTEFEAFFPNFQESEFYEYPIHAELADAPERAGLIFDTQGNPTKFEPGCTFRIYDETRTTVLAIIVRGWIITDGDWTLDDNCTWYSGQDNNNDKPQFFKSEADAQKYADQWLCEGYVITLVSI